MHRLASLPGDDPDEELTLVEQTSAPVIFLTSASTDIACLSSTLKLERNSGWENQIRALSLKALEHPAQIDHYISSSTKDTEIIIVRLLGSRGHWSYGLEKLQIWVKEKPGRYLIVLSGTQEHELELNSLGNIELEKTTLISELLKVGGVANMSTFLHLIENIIKGKEINCKHYTVESPCDPLEWDWRNEKGPKVGVILYRALLQADDTKLAEEINLRLRENSLTPRVLWVSSLRDENVQAIVFSKFKKENVRAVITTTSFSTVEFDQANLGSPLWDGLDIPVFQILTSSITKERWLESKKGLSPLDLTMQIALPELDGRILTRPCAFKTKHGANNQLNTAIHYMQPESTNLKWVSQHIKSWITLNEVHTIDKNICIVLANYPIRNSRLANGVGLDTPASTIEIIKWLDETGHYLGDDPYPKTSKELIEVITKTRTNDPESHNKRPLDYLRLSEYNEWWMKLPKESKEIITRRWGEPKDAIDLEPNGFPITGKKYGNLTILIQPSRGYDPDDIDDLHSPDLPPPHRYLAQYLWIRDIQKAHVVVHLGKHGSLEWLPGKGVGLSDQCFPHIAIDYLPNIYPFIVNDPGEGSQAKRRSQAVIIDHLTPPLSKSGLYGDLLRLEGLLEEYYECKLMASERAKLIEINIKELIIKNNWSEIDSKHKSTENREGNIKFLISEIESYLCEIKESQIRTGLHIFGTSKDVDTIDKLFFQIAQSPSNDQPGLSQWLTNLFSLELDPWNDDPTDEISNKDINILKTISNKNFRIKKQVIEYLNELSIQIIEYIKPSILDLQQDTLRVSKLPKPIKDYLKSNNDPYITYLAKDLYHRLLDSPNLERTNFLKAISGERVKSGPSGAPTRGRHEILPTGRNFYSVDLRGIPTESAWELGKKSAQNILDLHILENGNHLRKIALSVWGTATMRNGGEEICILFALMGIRPVWDGITRRVVDLEIIPLSVLGRPRVDIILRISGLFRDAFPQLINYVNKATKLLSILDEPDEMNPLIQSTKITGSNARIYGSAPGSYGAGLQALIDSGNWNSRKDIADAYIAWSNWRYDNDDKITMDTAGLKETLNDVQVVLHNQDNREHDILDSDDYYQFHGGITAAIETISGKKPEVLIGDSSRPGRPKIHKLAKEIDKVMRSRVLNPKWIDGMKKHGYKGAFEMGATLDYLFGYDAATELVPDWCYSEIFEQWLNTKLTRDFLSENNPWVLRDIAERLLESHNRAMWKSATRAQIDCIKKLIIEAEETIESDKFGSDIK